MNFDNITALIGQLFDKHFTIPCPCIGKFTIFPFPSAGSENSSDFLVKCSLIYTGLALGRELRNAILAL